MKKIDEMFNKLNTLKKEAEELSNNEEVTADEIKNKLDEIKDLKAKIELQKELDEEENNEINNKIDNGKMKKIRKDVDNMNKNEMRATKEYQEGFYNILRNKGLSKDQKEIFNTISTSGIPIPKSFQDKLLQRLEEMNIMRKLSSIMTTETDKDIPLVETQGVAEWTLENGNFNESDDTFTTITIKAFKLSRIIKVSEESLEDNTFDLEGYLVDSFARAISKPEEAAFINGDGNDKPTGLFMGADLGKTTASASAITSDEIIDLFYSVSRAYRQNGSWIMNDSTAKAVRKLKDSEGNYLWAKGFGEEPSTILGKPVYTSEFAPEIATGNNVIAFGDISYYKIGDRGSRTFQRLNELYSENGMVGFRGYERVDGKLTISEAVKTLKMA